MATATSGLALAAAAVTAAPVETKENFLQRFEHGFVSVLESFGKGADMALEFIIQYTPSAAKLADLILPGYQALVDGSATIVEAVATLLRNGVLEAEKAFANTVGSGAQKLASVLDTMTAPVLAILKAVKVNVNADWVKAAVNAVVGALKLQPFVTATA